MAPIMDEASDTDVFPHLILDSAMTGTELGLLTKFLKMKPPSFL